MLKSQLEQRRTDEPDMTSVARASTNAASLQKQLGTTFDIDQSRYLLLKSAGKGAFGTVVAARDAQTGDTVAIKKILRVFENSTAAKRVLRERSRAHQELENVEIALPAMYQTQNTPTARPPNLLLSSVRTRHPC